MCIFGFMDVFCESEFCFLLFGLFMRFRILVCCFFSVFFVKYESIEMIDNLLLVFCGFEFMRV